MAKNMEIAILLDFYGELLTPKQLDVIDLYYNEDLSLGEIAQHQQITRQGVLDSIQRAETLLTEFETKLGMLKKYRESREIFSNILSLSEQIYETSHKYNYSTVILNNSKKLVEMAKLQLSDEE